MAHGPLPCIVCSPLPCVSCRMWCLECDAQPTAACREHTFCLLERLVRQASTEAGVLLAEQEGLQRRLGEGQRGAVQRAAKVRDLRALRGLQERLRQRCAELRCELDELEGASSSLEDCDDLKPGVFEESPFGAEGGVQRDGVGEEGVNLRADVGAEGVHRDGFGEEGLHRDGVGEEGVILQADVGAESDHMEGVSVGQVDDNLQGTVSESGVVQEGVIHGDLQLEGSEGAFQDGHVQGVFVSEEGVVQEDLQRAVEMDSWSQGAAEEPVDVVGDDVIVIDDSDSEEGDVDVGSAGEEEQPSAVAVNTAKEVSL